MRDDGLDEAVHDLQTLPKGLAIDEAIEGAHTGDMVLQKASGTRTNVFRYYGKAGKEEEDLTYLYSLYLAESLSEFAPRVGQAVSGVAQ